MLCCLSWKIPGEYHKLFKQNLFDILTSKWKKLLQNHKKMCFLIIRLQNVLNEPKQLANEKKIWVIYNTVLQFQISRIIWTNLIQITEQDDQFAHQVVLSMASSVLYWVC